jgi:predicted RNase H-like HicB family nuclease
MLAAGAEGVERSEIEHSRGQTTKNDRLHRLPHQDTIAGALRYTLAREPHGDRQEMKSEYTAIIKKEGRWWIGWIEEVPGVNCQERTREELLETLRITLREALEFNRQDALSAAGADFSEERIAV